MMPSQGYTRSISPADDEVQVRATVDALSGANGSAPTLNTVVGAWSPEKQNQMENFLIKRMPKEFTRPVQIVPLPGR